MQRFYFPEITIQENIFILKDLAILSQLIKVLRIKPGDEIIFFNGQNNIDYMFSIQEIKKREIILILKEKIKKIGYKKDKVSLRQKVNLFQAFPNKLSKIEYIIQKGVEVGINNFTFFYSSRSQSLTLSDSKIIRLKKIMIEAIEQSNQNIIPQLDFKKDLDLEIIRSGNANLNLFFHTTGNNSIALKNIIIPKSKIINIFVGPEGGWDNSEVSYFEKLGYKKIFLGDLILRTETVSSVVGFFINQNN